MLFIFLLKTKNDHFTYLYQFANLILTILCAFVLFSKVMWSFSRECEKKAWVVIAPNLFSKPAINFRWETTYWLFSQIALYCLQWKRCAKPDTLLCELPHFAIQKRPELSPRLFKTVRKIFPHPSSVQRGFYHLSWRRMIKKLMFGVKSIPNRHILSVWDVFSAILGLILWNDYVIFPLLT